MNEEQTVLYAIEDLRMSQATLAYKLADALTSEGEYDVELGIVLLLRVPVASRELIERAAQRQGVTLTEVGDASNSGGGEEDVSRVPAPPAA